MPDWASAIIKGIKVYQADDIWVQLPTPREPAALFSGQVGAFGKILRNELNEDFRFVLQELEREIDRCMHAAVGVCMLLCCVHAAVQCSVQCGADD